MGRDLNSWIDYIQGLHPNEMELGLQRVATVYQRLFDAGVIAARALDSKLNQIDKSSDSVPAYTVISVAGTNGKGSTAELLASIYAQAGYRVGKFTSPHLVHFNERFLLNGKPVSDTRLLAAFECIERVRYDITITYFEYTALLAVVIFAQAQVDVAVMEVGLGGRLDAINMVDADLSIVTNISIDHTQWLGNTVELIAAEKIAIARAGKPCVVGMRELPQSIRNYCDNNAVTLLSLGDDFDYQFAGKQQAWGWYDKRVVNSSSVENTELFDLPLPYKQRGAQLDNAAVVLAAISALQGSLPVAKLCISKGIAQATLSGRCQIISQAPTIVLDVSHNQASAAYLSEFIADLIKEKSIKGHVYAICGMLQDKQISQSLSHLLDVVDHWHLVSIDNPRGATADIVKQTLRALYVQQNKQCSLQTHLNAVQAYKTVKDKLNNDDCLIVFGSFFVVGDIIALGL